MAAPRELISFGNLQKVLEEVLKQQRDMVATVQYLKATVEAHCSKEYVDEKLRAVGEQVASQEELLAQLRTDMFDVSNIANELPRLADAQAAGLAAIEQRVNVSMSHSLAETKQRALDLEIELKEKATTQEMRKMRLELDDRPRKIELRHLIDSTNKLRDSLGDRMDDLTERLWGMRNEGASSLVESTSVLDTKFTSAQRQLEALEAQQRTVGALVARLEKETLSKVSYAEVGGLKKEMFAQLHDVHALLSAEVHVERARTGRLESELAETNLAVAQRATLGMLSAAEARIDAHDGALAEARGALELRATGVELQAEAAARKHEEAQLRGLLQSKAETELVNELFVRSQEEARKLAEQAQRRSVEVDARLAALQAAVESAHERLARKADELRVVELDGAHARTAASVAELKVDLENVLKNLEAWMFDEPLAEPLADPTLASRFAGGVPVFNSPSALPPTPVAPAGSRLLGRAGVPPPSSVVDAAGAYVPRATAESENASATNAGVARVAGRGEPSIAASACAALPGGAPGTSAPAVPAASVGRAAPLPQPPAPAAGVRRDSASSPRPHQLATAPPRASAPSPPTAGASPTGTAVRAGLPLSLESGAARSDADRRRKALDDKRRSIVDARLKGGGPRGAAGSVGGAALPPIRDLDTSR